ncbi:MAG: DUF2071 domain-containing protein [Chitinophagales bacterium]|nr:DUF2071 domain-containing protein [Chitinophagales bacterium]
MNFLKNHPFAVEAFFESSIVLTFATPKEQIEDLIPECLELDTFQDKWAFIAVAMVQTRNLRPKGFPKFMGNDFFLIGYRIFVRYTTTSGKRLRGLYILKSETDKKKMEFLGNIFTHYNYTTTDILVETNDTFKTVRSQNSKFEIVIELSEDEVNIPEGSPFTDWKDARKFTGPLPFTFTFNKENRTVLIIEGVRQNWKPKPIKIKSYSIEFINSLKLQNVVLANAFEVTNIPYYWKKGKIDIFKSHT